MSNTSKHQNVLGSVFLAGVSNAVAASCTNPVDVIKVRMQLAGMPSYNLTGGSQMLGVLGTAKCLLRQEGLGGAYLGLTPSILRELSYSGLRMGLYEHVREQLASSFHTRRQGSSLEGQTLAPKQSPLFVKVLAGAITGAFGAALANPLDLIKVRMQGASGHYHRKNFLRTASDICNEGGGVVGGLWRGAGATVQRAALLTAAQVPSYDHSKHYFLDSNTLQEGYFCHFVCSMMAGVVAAAVTSPVDLAKSRLMSQPVDPNTGLGTLYSGTFDCLLKTLRSDGFMALFRGFNMQWLRLGPHTTISLMCFEQLRHLAGFSYL